MKSILQKVALMALLIGAAISCTKDLDFNQAKDFEATPTYEAGVFYLEAPENIINLVSGNSIISQNFNFQAFSSNLFAERVLDGVITYVVENTTSKSLRLTIDFLNARGIITDTEIFTVPPAPTAIIQREITYGDAGESIGIIRTLTTIRVTTENLGDNTSVSQLPSPLIKVKSSGKFRVRLK